jgi:hypothetical protein
MYRKNDNVSDHPTGNIYEKLGEEQPPDTIPPPIPDKIVELENSGSFPPEPPPPAPEDTPIYLEGQDYSFTASQVIELAKQDMSFLAGLAMPETFRYMFPKHYLAAWQLLTEAAHKVRDFTQIALGWPRGFAKTTKVKLFVLYCILFTQKKFIAVLCENEKKAVNVVSDVMDMLSELNIRKAFGDWESGTETDQQALKKFGFRGRNIILLATTVEAIRGYVLKNARPDVMIFDDIQSRKDADSQVISETIEREMYGTAMKAKSPHGCLFLFVGNMYPTKWSILRKIKSNPNWIKFIAGGILADGTSLWEELQPIAQLHREFLNDLSTGHPEIFYAEVLNDETAQVNNTFDISKIPTFPFQDTDIPAGRFIVIDPSNDKATSDQVAIGYFEVHNGYPVLKEVIEERLSPGDIIRKTLTICFRHGVSLVVIESNAFQYSLLYWFGFITTQMGVTGIEPVEIYSGVQNKNARILAMFLQLLKGEVYIHPSIAPQVLLQATQFNPLVRNNTDNILDLLTYAPKALEMYGAQILASAIINEQEFGATGVLEDNCVYLS